nr:hypothetical protein [Streptomyces malaysiense]
MARYVPPGADSALRAPRRTSRRFDVPLRALACAVAVARPPDGPTRFPARRPCPRRASPPSRTATPAGGDGCGRDGGEAEAIARGRGPTPPRPRPSACSPPTPRRGRAWYPLHHLHRRLTCAI